jgi:photosystem II stability/assembly factor-like uncharacterized protein
VAVAAIGLTIALRRQPAPGTARFDAPDAAGAYALARRAPVHDGVALSTIYDRAAAQRDRLPRFASRIGRTLPAAYAPTSVWTARGRTIAAAGRVSPTAVLDAWTPLGPGNIGGRTRVIRYQPTKHTTLFAAGVSGGIWKSEDDGGSWRPIGDGLANLAVNTLAIDPRQPDVMYAGTGEGYMREEIRGTGLPLRGSGIFVTRDGGSTWQRLASTTSDDFLWVNDIELGVGDARRLYAATRTGVWRSLDAGQTWSQLLSTNVRAGCLDLAMRPDQPDDALFASCGSYEQATVYRFARASSASNPEEVLREANMGRTSVAISPSRPDTMYALAASNDPGPGGNYEQGLLAVYRSDRGGVAGSWQPRITNTDPSKLNTLLLTNAGPAMVEECGAPPGRNSYATMGWYNNVIAVDPRDPERVWAAGVQWFRSDDGGRTWGIAAYQTGAPGVADSPHVDQHAITFHPEYDGQGNQIVVIGNDGGLARTANARARVSTGSRATCTAATSIEVKWESLNRGYGVTQFYHGLPYPDGERYFGGAQDNSTLVGSDGAGPDGWRAIIGGDGGYVAIHPTNPQLMYGETQWANVVRSIDGGIRFTSATAGLDPARSSGVGPQANYLFITPFVMDPADPNRLWLGGAYLYRSSNAAALWTKVSTVMPDGGLASAIAVAPGDPTRVIAGTSKGDIVSSRAALAATSATAWDVTRPRDGWITSVAFDPRNPSIVYATYGNFGGAHVYRSTNGGAAWSATDGAGARGLPDIPVHCLVVDPDNPSRLYLGTDLGVFVSLDAGSSWMVEETGFGPAVTEWLALVRDSAERTRLFAFTHGRGAWRVDLR